MPGESGSPALLGRERERAELDDALALALDGSPQTVLVGGDAGIGKTTLVDRPGPPCRGARVPRGRGPLSGHRRRRRLRRRPRGGARADRAGRGPRLASLRAPDERAAGPGGAPEPRALPRAGGPAPDRARGRCRRTRCCSCWRTCTGPAGRRRTSPWRSRAGPVDGCSSCSPSAPTTCTGGIPPAGRSPRSAGSPAPGTSTWPPSTRRASPASWQSHARRRGRRGAGALGAGPFGGQPALRRGAGGRRPAGDPRAAVRPVPGAGGRAGRRSA